MFVGTQHGSLQNADAVLIHLYGLINSFYLNLGDFRWGEKGKGILPSPIRVALDIPDLLFGKEPLLVRAKPEREGVNLRAVVYSSEGQLVREAMLLPDEEGWMTAQIGPLPEDAYTVRVAGTGGVVEPVEGSVAVGG
jgi:hypothetical protein